MEFRPRAPWWGGDLQTLRNSLALSAMRLPGRSERLRLDLRDGSGDRLAASLDRPENAAGKDNGPLIVLIHGLAGSEESAYVRRSAAFHLRRGRKVLRLNLRGAGPSRGSCQGHYHAGCASDVAAALGSLPNSLPTDGLFLVGFSLGGNVLLNLLADCNLPLIGAATVSAPIEPAEASRRFMEPRNTIYHRWLLRKTKQECLAPGARLSADERRAIVESGSIYEFDDRFIAPRHGFKNADDYYARTAGARLVPRITVPTLMIHARDDPWIPLDAYEKIRPGAPSHVEIALTPGGGHVGFHAKGSPEAWHDLAIDWFLRAL